MPKIVNFKLLNAKILGNKAFKEGKKRIPCHDPKFIKLLVGVKVGEANPLLDSWLSAWDEENLK